MDWIRRNIIDLMYEYNVHADETIEELADDIMETFKEKYSICPECGSELK